MEETNFYTDIIESIKLIFSFLQKKYGFSDFEERQIAYEMHYEAHKDDIMIDIWFEAIVSTPIWAKINNYYIDNLELENENIKRYNKRLDEIYDTIEENSDTKCFENKFSQYYKYGQELNTFYLTEIANLLKRYSSVLEGNFELLEANTQLLIAANKKETDALRIEKGTYTIEFQLFSKDDYDMYVEFDSLEDAKRYLSEDDTIKVYRILDCYMNEINWNAE
ncbi:hypothetical protein [Sphingobacterium detergens]|uniref:Uncharacterized protein n=1 Tax=Sphingobacterium detergens TaxID=1145106 RepID=A0A420BH45_SPHD1|nr:hypothetical protein [Sphingobacterium detergens]RKE56061.1 hypothetical protein DFQ12_0913 [Sphingobacterium detergens]